MVRLREKTLVILQYKYIFTFTLNGESGKLIGLLDTNHKNHYKLARVSSRSSETEHKVKYHKIP